MTLPTQYSLPRVIGIQISMLPVLTIHWYTIVGHVFINENINTVIQYGIVDECACHAELFFKLLLLSKQSFINNSLIHKSFILVAKVIRDGATRSCSHAQ